MMSVPSTSTAAAETCAPSRPTKLKILVAVHLALGALPVLMAWVPADVHFLPLLWGLHSIGISQIMLLSLWVGVGTNPLRVRLLGTLAGIAYVTAWPPLAMCFSAYSNGQSIGERIGDY